MTSPRLFQSAATFSAALAVIIGAVGAHGPLAPDTAELQALLATASLFHLTHSLALLQFGMWLDRHRMATPITGWLFIAGMLCFIGTLDWHVFSGHRFLGPLTPVGGGMLIAAWLVWTLQILRSPTAER